LINIHKFSNDSSDFSSKISHAKDMVDWPAIEHISVQGRLDARGGLYHFWCPNTT
jgi:hypothetical protein